LGLKIGAQLAHGTEFCPPTARNFYGRPGDGFVVLRNRPPILAALLPHRNLASTSGPTPNRKPLWCSAKPNNILLLRCRFSLHFTNLKTTMDGLESRFERITVTDENEDGAVIQTVTYHKPKVLLSAQALM
jgi:hypothetical protein